MPRCSLALAITWIVCLLRGSSVRSSAEAYNDVLAVLTEKKEKTVEEVLPSARIIAIHGGNHYVYLSNEAEVFDDLSAFLARMR